MTKFMCFISFSSIAYWLIIGDIDFYKIITSILIILLCLYKEIADSWKYEATRARIISEQMLKDIDTLYGEGATDKLLSLAKANTLKHLKELGESGKEIPDIICKELERMKAVLEKQST